MSNIIITGANQGIGYFLVEQLLKENNKVAVLDLETDNLAKLKETYQDMLLYFPAAFVSGSTTKPEHHFRPRLHHTTDPDWTFSQISAYCSEVRPLCRSLDQSYRFSSQCRSLY